MSDVTAVVDVHEPGTISGHLDVHDDVDDWGIHGLESADIIVNGVGFERKTPEDYAGSLTSGRLKDQVIRLADAFDHAYLLVEGDIGDFDRLTHTQVSAASLRGSVASFAARHNVHTLFCGESKTLVDMAVRVARKHTEEPSSDHIPTPDVDGVPVGVQMWATLPHVGPELAQRLYGLFGAPTCLFGSWPTQSEKLQSVDGIGEKTAADIVDAMRDRPDHLA